MIDLLKFVILACGCVALYGLATGQDLNELFMTASDVALPAAKNVIQGIWDFIVSALNNK